MSCQGSSRGKSVSLNLVKLERGWPLSIACLLSQVSFRRSPFLTTSLGSLPCLRRLKTPAAGLLLQDFAYSYRVWITLQAPLRPAPAPTNRREHSPTIFTHLSKYAVGCYLRYCGFPRRTLVGRSMNSGSPLLRSAGDLGLIYDLRSSAKKVADPPGKAGEKGGQSRSAREQGHRPPGNSGTIVAVQDGPFGRIGRRKRD